jgi:hypothetical protein
MQKLIGTGFLLISMLLSARHSNAQEKVDFRGIDSLTWAAYCRSDWKGVIAMSQKGFRSGIDFYYLRMRAGIAHYMLKNYDGAIAQFEKARKFNEIDPAALDYLYYANILTNREGEAGLVARKMVPGHRDSLKIKTNILKIFVEGGSFSNPDADSLLAYNPGGSSAHSYQVTRYSYASIGSMATLTPRIHLTVAFQRINYSITEQFRYPTLNPYVFDVSFGENSFYTGTRIVLGQGVNLLGGFRFLNGQYTYHIAQAYPGGMNLIDTVGIYSDVATNMTLQKRFPYLGIGVSADLNRFKGTWYEQAGASLSFYPLGNLNLYLVGDISRTATLDGWIQDGNWIWKGKLGAKVLPFAWVETSYSKGWLHYWSENQAYVVYNNFDPITSRFELSLMCPRLLSHLDLSFRFNYNTRVAGWAVTDPSGSTQIVGKNYSFNSFIVGGTWNF